MKRLFKSILAGLLLLGCVSQSLYAATVSYSLRNVSGNTWEYDFTLTTVAPLAQNEGFSVYFDVGEAENLTAISSPQDWSVLTIEPGSFIGDPTSRGFYDALSMNGLGAGASLSGFILQLDWLNGSPRDDEPDFEIYALGDDPNTSLTSLKTGTASVVPIPAALWLFISAIAGLFAFGRRRT